MPGADQERASEAKEAIAELGRVATIEELEGWIEKNLDLLAEEARGELGYLINSEVTKLPSYFAEDHKGNTVDIKVQLIALAISDVSIEALRVDGEEPEDDRNPLLRSLLGKSLPIDKLEKEELELQGQFSVFVAQKLVDSGKLDDLFEEES
jgi:hypothetical protein